MSTYFPLRADARLKEKIFNSIDSYPGVRIGTVLAANYSPNVKILCSSKSYIPTEFMNIKMDPMNMTIEEMKRYDPDIIILRMNSVEFWRTVPGDYSPYALGYVKECRQYYEILFAVDLGYRRVASEGSGENQFILYERIK